MEENTISFRGKIRIFSYISFALVALTIFSVVQSVKVKRYQKEILLSEQRALISLDEYLSDISTDLQKSVYVSTPEMFSNLSVELWRDTAEAKNSLSTLPSSEASIANTYKFLSQVGEYVMSLERKLKSGQTLTEEERQKLLELSKYAETLSEKISAMCYGMQNGTFSFERESYMFLKTDKISENVFDKMDDVEQSVSDFPSLIFDGPFSNHIESLKPKAVEGKEEITKNEALEKAKTVCEEENMKFAFEEDGTIPCYVFKTSNCTIAITKNGGYPLYMLNDSFAGEMSIKYEDAVSIAKDYLKKIGYSNMQESYYFTDDGICTVNFAYSQNGIICYADLIKVSVNMQTGKIHSFDATGYISCHEERKVPERLISKEECQQKLYNGLDVLASSACYTPTKWGTETLCYEYVCTTKDGQHLLVYLNALTGKEEDVLILLYSDGGVLTK